MNTLPRAAAGVVTFVAVFYFSFWMIFSLVIDAGLAPWMRVPGSLLIAVLATGYVWRELGAAPTGGSAGGGVFRSVTVGAILTGAIGLVAGFFGPMIADGDAPQGPMLGLFVTGPAGAVLGAIGGGAYWLVRRRLRA